jgi:hypothetical protein
MWSIIWNSSWKGNRVKPFPKWFWWLKCPTQIIGLTSLLYIICSTGAKGSAQTNKKIKVSVQKKGAKETEENSSLAHRTIRYTRVDRLQTLHLRVSVVALRYNSPDCPVWQRSNDSPAQRSTPTVDRQLNSARTVRAESEQCQKAHRTVNSTCPVRHRTIRCPKMSELQRSKPSQP